MADIEPFAGLSQEDTQQALVSAIRRLLDNVGVLSPDLAGRLRVTLETQTISGITTVTTVSSVTTVTTVGTVTNQAQIGGLAANQQMIALTLGSEGDLRSNILIT